MEKVKLPREVAEAIEAIKSSGEYTRAEIVIAHTNPNVTWQNQYASFRGMKLDDLCSALYNGYEVEQTQEERVREYVEKLRFHHMNNNGGRNDAETSFGHELRGCLKTLTMLNIKIKGVND